MKHILAIVILAAGLMGCAEQQAAVVAANSVAKGIAQNAADDVIAGDLELLCAQPYSAVVRNTGKYPGLAMAFPQLCGKLPSILYQPMTVPQVP